jgi:hypothetical protein
LLFTKDGGIHIVTALKLNQLVYIVLACKFTALARLMFQNPALQVVGHACIENGVMCVGHDVNAVLFFGHVFSHCHCEGDGFRLKQSPHCAKGLLRRKEQERSSQ